MLGTNDTVTALIAGLTPENREMPTPCDEWTVHDLIGHMCGGAHMIAGALQGEAPPDEAPDFLADGPAAGWSAAAAHLTVAATPEALTATHQMPFGEIPGEMALSIIAADHLTHAWDLATATGQQMEVSEELAEFAYQAWLPLIPAEGRTGDGFKAAVPVADDAGALERLIAYTGRSYG